MNNNTINNNTINNKTIFNYINLYNDFNDISLIGYLSKCLNIHKERITIKKIINIDSSNNMNLKDNIGINDYFILLNETRSDIFIDKLLDNSLNDKLNDTLNNRIVCNSYNNLIINEPTKLNLSNDANKYVFINNENNVKYIIFFM
tara:strand:- start:87 stop:524 length:438 start_codon:yes stop_codon:yes gene_type:complete